MIAEGSAPAPVGVEYEFTVTCVDPLVPAVSVEPVTGTAAAGESVVFDGLPAGAECTVVESGAHGASEIVYSPEGGKVTIAAGQTVEVSVTNSFPWASFTLVKELAGDTASLAGVTFEVSYTYQTSADSIVTWIEVLTPGVVTEPVQVPPGTVVTVAEVVPAQASGYQPWKPVVISGSGVTQLADGSATFTATLESEVAVTITNEADLLPGSFTLVKNLAGDTANLKGVTFDVTYSYGSGASAVTKTLTLAPGVVSESVVVPAGTVVTVTEKAPAQAAGFQAWKPVVISGTGVTQSADGSASFTVGSSAGVAVTVTNEADAVVTPKPTDPPKPSDPPKKPLPNTGADLVPFAAGGALLLLAGAVLLVVRRRGEQEA